MFVVNRTKIDANFIRFNAVLDCYVIFLVLSIGGPRIHRSRMIQLACYSDASENAYGCVIYCIAENEFGERSSKVSVYFLSRD